MKHYIATALAGAMLLAAPAWAEEEDGEEAATEPKAAAESSIKELADLGAGVHKPRLDENNTLRSCVIVGTAPISKAFGKARGVLDAKKKAKLNAEAEFVGWLKKTVSDVQQSGDTTTLQIAAGALDENGEPIETGEKTETLSQITTSQAQGQLRGMRLLGVDQDGENGIMTMVYAWKPEYAAAAAGASGAMNTADAAPGQAAPTGIDAPAGGSSSASGASGAAGGSSSGSGKSKVKIESKTRLAEGADEFL